MNWTSDDINRIISNGKYRGDSFLQKTYAMDYLTKKGIDNDDTIHQYYITTLRIITKRLFQSCHQSSPTTNR